MTENNDGFTSATQDIGAANAAVAQYFGPQTVDIPTVEGPGLEEVELPAGYLTKQGELVTKAFVRELTGEDEEALAKTADNPSRYFSTLLERGVVKIGEERPTKAVFQDLLTGDRAALVLGIRRATYDDDIETRAYCPTCEEWIEVEFNLGDDVNVVKLEEPEKRVFEIELRKGRKAEVTLVDGAIENEVLASTKLNGAQLDTLILSKCVRSIDGQGVLGRTGPVQALGVADRKKILAFLNSKQFGPDYSSISFTHDVCGEEVPVVINAGELFRF